MRPNLFFYLLKQSILKSLEGAFLGIMSFSIIALVAFVVAQEFLPLSDLVLTWQAILFGICALVLFVCFIVAGGTALALWLFWRIRSGKFSLKVIIETCMLASFITWIGFFMLVVAPITWATWHGFFTRHDILATFFDILSLAISLGSGIWAGWQLFKEFEKQKMLVPDMFIYQWNFKDWRTHFRLFWKGGGLGLICAVLIGFIFALGLGLSIFLPNHGTLDFKGILFVGGLLTMFSSVPALLGGYLIAGFFHLEKLNGLLTRKSAFWQAVILAALAGFGVCTVVGGIYLTNPHTVSVLFVTPYIFGITILAGIAGGIAGLVLYPHI